MNENLYQPPSAPISPPQYYGEEGAIPPAAMGHLIGTQPWAGLTGVIGLLTTILNFGVAIYVLTLFERISRIATPMIIMILLVAYLVIHPLIRLCKYGAAINRLKATQSEANFGAALHQQRLFWRFVGVVTLIFIILFVIFLLISLMRPASRF